MIEIAKIDDYVIATGGHWSPTGITIGKKYKVLNVKQHGTINYLIMDDFNRSMFYDHRDFMLVSEFIDKQLKKIGI